MQVVQLQVSGIVYIYQMAVRSHIQQTGAVITLSHLLVKYTQTERTY